MKLKKIIFSILVVLLVVGLIYVINKGNITADKAKKEISAQPKDTDADIVMKDDYFIEQLNDIYYNTDEYLGKTIKIEGFPMVSKEYKFVARFGPGCCVGDGYAYIEYTYDKELELVDEEDWIRVIGVLKKGKMGVAEYVYIEATSVEKLEERGNDTVLT